jgi:PAS domain S-box-containing protein
MRERRFWVVQALVLLATLVHILAEGFEDAASHSHIYLFSVLMYALFAVPIVYASLNFGMDGAVPTALWSGLLALPNVVLWHSGTDRLAELAQHAFIMGLAVLIAIRVDREVAARRSAEQAALARRQSEARYRALFEAAGEAILVFDDDGQVRDVNAAATALFSRPADALRGLTLAQLLGDSDAERLRAAAVGRVVDEWEFRLSRPDGQEVWLAAVCGDIPSQGDGRLRQALLRDVTDQRQRRRGLEAYARQTLIAQEEERRRIARELHDGPLQGLILLCRTLDDLATNAPSTRAPGTEQLREARQTAESIADEVRRSSRDLRPSVLDDLGLVPALRWLVKDLEQRTGIRAHFYAPEERERLDPETELALFRIAQEAVRNVERHAGASNLFVTITRDGVAERLVVEDDGRGIDGDPTGAAIAGHLGMLGMRERARLLGGTFAAGSGDGHGTRVEVDVPVRR